ncbi:MAG: hypothetical protein ACJ74Z_00840 [Bryobacteraceae bacterium]
MRTPVEAADLNQDMNDEIVVGFRGKPYGVHIYSWNGTKWERQVLEHGGMSAASCVVSELDGKGRPEIACIGSATHNLVLYRNQGP